MTLTLDDIVRATKAWPSDKVEELLSRLAENLQDADGETTNAWKLEVDRRVEEIVSGKVEGVDGDEVLARARRQFGR